MRILIAKDEAFNFIYRANIDSLRTMGEVRFFSPLHDSHLPSCDILYLPGGYPELYLDDISGNSEMMAEIKAYSENGGRIFAECGGFTILTTFRCAVSSLSAPRCATPACIWATDRCI